MVDSVLPVEPFEHAYDAPEIRFGRGCVTDLSEPLADRAVERAMVVCGSNVGSNSALMDPIREGLGDRVAAVFDGTTPEKSIEAAYAGVEAARDCDADALVAVGGGSSLDTAKAIRLLYSDFRSPDELREEVAATGRIPVPADAPLVPLVVVPTTLAGADLSVGGSAVLPPAGGDPPLAARLSHPNGMPTAAWYDPSCFETTPTGPLVGSAMNGFDKGIEVIYSRGHDAVTDATAVRGLRLLRSSLPRLRESNDPAVVDRAVAGIVLSQYGFSSVETTKLSVIHAFGHGLSGGYPLQQGVAHAVAAPHVLRWLFAAADARRGVLTEAFDVDDADGVVREVREVRDGLGLPSRLRDVDGPPREAFSDVAEAIRDDGLMANAPPGADPTVEDVEEVLRAAW